MTEQHNGTVAGGLQLGNGQTPGNIKSSENGLTFSVTATTAKIYVAVKTHLQR